MALTQIPTQLWNRDFRLFFTARTTSVMGDTMLPVAITAALIEAGYGVTGVGLALAAHMAPFVVLLVFGGVLSDRFGARRMMIVSDSARLVFQAVLAGLFVLGTPTLWQILVCLALLGASGAIFQPGIASVTPRIAQDVQKANATLRISESFMTVIGPSSAGLLLAVASPALVLAIDALTFAVSGMCLFLMRSVRDAPTVRVKASTFRTELAEGWTEFRSHTWLWAVIVIWSVAGVTAWGPSHALGNSLITERHGASIFGLIMAAQGAGNMIGGLLAAKIKPQYPLRVGAMTMACFLFIPLTVALDLPPAALAVGYLAAGVGGALWAVMFYTSVQTRVPQELLGRVHSYEVAGSVVMGSVGRAVAGPVTALAGVVPVLLTSTAMVLVACTLLLAVPAIRNLRRT